MKTTLFRLCSIFIFWIGFFDLDLSQSFAETIEIGPSKHREMFGKVEQSAEAIKINLKEPNLVIEWRPGLWILTPAGQNPIQILMSKNIDSTEQENLSSSDSENKIEEKDLGGKTKKKPPLKHRNPQKQFTGFTSKNPKPSGPESKIIQSVRSDSWLVFKHFYKDGTTLEVAKHPQFSWKESIFKNKKNEIVWEDFEVEEQPFIRIHRTNWQDASWSINYEHSTGSVSCSFDSETDQYQLSFFTADKRLAASVLCKSGSCERI